MIKNYRDLHVWQNAIRLTELVYCRTRTYPRDERFGLVSQMNRAAVSVPSNIAEGHGRNTTGEYLQHLGIARGSLYELETQIEISGILGFLPPEESDILLEQCSIVSKLLAGLMRSLK